MLHDGFVRPPRREEAHVEGASHLLHAEVGPVDEAAIEDAGVVAPPVGIVDVEVGVADGKEVGVRVEVGLEAWVELLDEVGVLDAASSRRGQRERSR